MLKIIKEDGLVAEHLVKMLEHMLMMQIYVNDICVKKRWQNDLEKQKARH